MKILLIKPPFSRLKGCGQAPCFPLGLGYLASTLDKNGYYVRIYHAENPRLPGESIIEDEEAIFHQRSQSQKRYFDAIEKNAHPVWTEVRDTIKEFRPDIVGISVLTVETPSALKISKIVKEYNPDVPVVWGGVHPSFISEDVISYNPVDFVVRGEGEEIFLNLCKAIEKGKNDFNDILGITYIKDGKIKHNPNHPLVEDINSIPFPATHLILYPESFDYRSMGSMIVSRGCPLRCTFCSSRLFWKKRFRLRSEGNIIDEIKQLKERYDINYIMFWDDSFSISKDLIIRYCDALIESGLKLKWHTATRADLVDNELLHRMKKAGCVKLNIGVETGSPRMQKTIRKDVTNDIIRDAYKMIKANGIATGAFFMAGFPDETLEDLDQSWDLMKELNIDEVAFNVFDPMPGSELLDRCTELGLVPEKPDWSNFKFWPDNYFIRGMTHEEFDKKAIEIGNWVYKYNNRLLTKFNRQKALILFYLVHDRRMLFKKAIGYLKRRKKVRHELSTKRKI